MFESIISSSTRHWRRGVNKARGVKAKASKPRPETCEAKATEPRPRPRPRMRKEIFPVIAKVNPTFQFRVIFQATAVGLIKTEIK